MTNLANQARGLTVTVNRHAGWEQRWATTPGAEPCRPSPRPRRTCQEGRRCGVTRALPRCAVAIPRPTGRRRLRASPISRRWPRGALDRPHRVADVVTLARAGLARRVMGRGAGDDVPRHRGETPYCPQPPASGYLAQPSQSRVSARRGLENRVGLISTARWGPTSQPRSSARARDSAAGPETTALDEDSSHLPRVLYALAARSERPDSGGQLAPGRTGHDSEFLATFWRLGGLNLAC